MSLLVFRFRLSALRQSHRDRQGKEAKLSYNGNLLVENRNGLIVNTEVFEANGTAERDAALVMLEQIPGTKQVTVGGDKAYDTADFVAECRNLKVTPHVAQNLERPGGSAIDARTTQHPGYAISQRKKETYRRVLRMAEDNRAVPEGSASWNLQGGMGLYLCGRCLQLSPYEESGAASDLS
jgi:DDE family transposase